MLVVDREVYRGLVRHRKQVCPVFAEARIDEAAIDRLPESGVPEPVLESAQHMPETRGVKTVLHAPANRVPLCSMPEEPGSDAESSASEALGAEGGDLSSGAHPAEAPSAALPADVLNEHETVVGVDEQSCPKPLRLFQAWSASMDRLNSEAAKVAAAHVQQVSTAESKAEVATREVAAKEVIRTSIAVDMTDIARQMVRTNSGRADLERLVVSQSQEQQEPRNALAVPTGKPLSMFDPSALPAAYTEFLFGDCVPFLKRATSVTCQQLFDALPSREELEYALPQDETPYRASGRSRFDSPEFYAVFASFLRSLKLLQSCKAAFDRPGFEKDVKIIASCTSSDFVEAALHPSQPRTNEDLIRTAGSEKVRTALRHLGFSTATVPLTDGNKMRLHHLGCAMNRAFGPLSMFHTHNYADNYSPEILTLLGSDGPHLAADRGSSSLTQNVEMPTLQQMHKHTAASPRSTAKLFLLLEELSYRHLYRVDRAFFGRFRLNPVGGWKQREDDFASNGLRGIADFVQALLKVIEAQARGFAHGHGKTHSVPDGLTTLETCLRGAVAEIANLELRSGAHPAEAEVESLVSAKMQSHNERLLSSCSTRQYESSVLPARQLGQEVRPAPFSEKQQRQSRYDGGGGYHKHLCSDHRKQGPCICVSLLVTLQNYSACKS